MWKAIPEKRLKKIRKMAQEMPPSRDRTVLILAFVHGLTTTEIAEVAKTREDLYSRNHRPMSRRRIQQVILQYVPDANDYQDHSQKEKQHKDHGAFAWSHKKERCGKCGCTENLEWHHMAPAILGGTADERNMICLCHECHRAVTEYNRTLFPDEMNSWKKKRAEEQKDEK